MDRSTPGLPVHHQLPEFTQTHVQSVMSSNHLILCHPLLLLPTLFPSIRVFSNESTLRIRWPKYWSFSFKISPSDEHPRLSRVFSNTTVQKHQFFGTQLPGASVRNSARGKGHKEGGSAYTKAGSSLRSPPGNSRASTPQNQSLPTSLPCALTYTSDFMGGCPPPPVSEKELTYSSS